MRLLVATPQSIVLDRGDVTGIRAEDETGAFGILEGHADFLTALSISVITWRNHLGAVHHVAVSGGMLEVQDRRVVRVATREAVADDDLARLQSEVLSAFRRRAEVERTARTDAQRLYLAALRQIHRLLQATPTNATLEGPAP